MIMIPIGIVFFIVVIGRIVYVWNHDRQGTHRNTNDIESIIQKRYDYIITGSINRMPEGSINDQEMRAVFITTLIDATYKNLKNKFLEGDILMYGITTQQFIFYLNTVKDKMMKKYL